jgi:hypothetical protein
MTDYAVLARELISDSMAQNSAVYADYSAGLDAEMWSLCDDWTEYPIGRKWVREYWGESESGDTTWIVRIEVTS